LKGRYYFSNVKSALNKRYRLVKKALKEPKYADRWVEAMTSLINKQSPSYFRWHDSGDIFSLEYAHLMLRVIRETGRTRHWIPTKEVNTVGLIQHEIPPNAIFRWSSGQLSTWQDDLRHRFPVAHVMDFAKGVYGTPESIHMIATQGGLLCLAAARKTKNGQACGNCRACWDPKVNAVVYPLH
jgi:hypothetical protein